MIFVPFKIDMCFEKGMEICRIYIIIISAIRIGFLTNLQIFCEHQTVRDVFAESGKTD
jgi:hypothetical protein